MKIIYFLYNKTLRQAQGTGALYFLILFLIVNFSANAQKWQWAQKYGADGASYNNPYHMVLDSAGNAYVYGTYGNGTQIDTMELPWFASHDANTYVAKFASDGHCEWYRAINSQVNNDEAHFMTIKNNKLYLWGNVTIDNYYNTFFLDTTVYGGIITQQWLGWQYWKMFFPWNPSSYYDMIISLDLNGNILQKKFLSYNTRLNVLTTPNPSAFHIDEAGNYYVISTLGTYSSNKYVLYADTIALTDSLSYLYKGQHIMYKLSPSFQLLWNKPLITAKIGGNMDPQVSFRDVVSDNAGNMYYTGSVYLNSNNQFISTPETIMFDNTHGITFNNSPHSVMFLMKMDTSGTIQWLQHTTNYTPDSLNCAANASGFSLAYSVDEHKLFVSGYGQSKTKFTHDCVLFTPNDTLTTPYNYYFNPGAGNMGFIAIYDENGNFLNKMVSPVTRGSYLGNIAYHNHAVYGGMWWGDSLRFQNSWIVKPTNSVGYSYCKWNTQGELMDVKNVLRGTVNNPPTNPYETQLDPLGNMWVGGTLGTSLDFGGHQVSDWGVSYLARFNNQCDDTVQVKPTSGIQDTAFCINTNIQLIGNPNNVYYVWGNGNHTNTQTVNYAAAGTDSLFVVVYDGKCYWTDTIVLTINSCIGIDEVKENPMKIYPNPAVDFVNISLPQYYKDAQLSVLNSQGQIQYSAIISSKEFKVDVSHYATGIYIVLLKTGDGVFSRKVVRN